MAGPSGDTGNGGYGGSFGVTGGLGTVPEAKFGNEKGNLIFETEQEVDFNAGASINVFSATSTAGKAAFESPQALVIQNTGDAGLGLSLTIPYYSADGVAGSSRFIQMVLPVGRKIDLGTTRIIETTSVNFNDGTPVTSFTTPSSDLYVDTDLDSEDGSGGDITGSASETKVFIEQHSSATDHGANYFRTGDIIRVNNEIMEVTAIGSGADAANTYLTVKRGVYGSTAVDTHADDAAIRLAFFNKNAEYNKYSTVHTDSNGRYSSSNFFGLGRGTTITSSGLVPGSAAFIFYSEPYQEMGITGASSSSSSGLTSGATYYIHVAVNGGTAFEVGFVVDNASFGGTNGILAKIQTILNTQYHTTGSALNGKRISVGFSGGDIRWTFHERKSGSVIALTAGTSGADTTTELLAQAIGVFPASAKTAIPTRLPSETYSEPTTYESKPNTTQMLVDNGNGQFVGGIGSGRIDYETGAFSIQTYPNAELQYVVSHSSGFGGRISSTKTNVIEEVYAVSTNPKVNSKINLKVYK